MRALMVLILVSIAPWARPAHQPVRALQDNKHSVVLGNDNMSVTVQRTGRLSAITANGREYIWMTALYTRPMLPDGSGNIRSVQGETSRGGIGPPPPLPQPQFRNGYATITISRDCLREEIHDGQPLYHLTETICVHPGGYVSLRYEFDWLRFFVMHSASLNVVFHADRLTGHKFWADYTDHIERGTFTTGKSYSRIDGIRGAVRTLQIASDAGPIHLWVNRGERVTAKRWGNTDYYPISLRVPGTARNTAMYPGMETVLELSIKLPIADGGQNND